MGRWEQVGWAGNAEVRAGRYGAPGAGLQPAKAHIAGRGRRRKFAVGAPARSVL